LAAQAVQITMTGIGEKPVSSPSHHRITAHFELKATNLVKNMKTRQVNKTNQPGRNTEGPNPQRISCGVFVFLRATCADFQRVIWQWTLQLSAAIAVCHSSLACSPLGGLVM
jgi:hypothetical protein